MANQRKKCEPPANVAHWTRDGFAGRSTWVERPHHSCDYVSVSGPHAAHRLRLANLALPDREHRDALPVPFLIGRTGVQLSASARQATMPFVVSNVEADEIHFVQDGQIAYDTDHGSLVATPGDFVCIPRAVQYRVRPLSTPTLSLIAEIPQVVSLASAGPGSPLAVWPTVRAPMSAGDETTVVIKAFDGVTRYVRPHDPLAITALKADEESPVWKLNLAQTPLASGGPPIPFVTTPGTESMLFNLSARPFDFRPPIHHNADYDEVICYVRGPGAYGAIREPGTLTWTPKGIPHHGPSECVPEGYSAWLLETRGTLRLTPAGQAAAELLETGEFGRHPANDRVPTR